MAITDAQRLQMVQMAINRYVGSGSSDPQPVGIYTGSVVFKPTLISPWKEV